MATKEGLMKVYQSGEENREAVKESMRRRYGMEPAQVQPMQPIQRIVYEGVKNLPNAIPDNAYTGLPKNSQRDYTNSLADGLTPGTASENATRSNNQPSLTAQLEQYISSWLENTKRQMAESKVAQEKQQQAYQDFFNSTNSIKDTFLLTEERKAQLEKVREAEKSVINLQAATPAGTFGRGLESGATLGVSGAVTEAGAIARAEHPIINFMGEMAGRGLWGGIGEKALGKNQTAQNMARSLSGLTGGKLSVDVALNLLAGRVVDLPGDIAQSAVDSETPEEFAKKLGMNQAIGLGMDSALEAIGGAWRAIKTNHAQKAPGGEKWYNVRMDELQTELNGGHTESPVKNPLIHSANPVDTAPKTEYDLGVNDKRGNFYDRAGNQLLAGRPGPSKSNRDVVIGGEYPRRNSGISAGPGVISQESRTRLSNSGIPDFGLEATDDHDFFSRALDEARSSNKNGAAVDFKTADELQGAVTFMSKDGTAGGAVMPDGDVTAVFKNPTKNIKKGAGKDIAVNAVAHGGKKLDCYGKFLVDNYAPGGFEPVARVAYAEGINPAMDAIYAGKPKPDIYFMKLRDGYGLEEVVGDLENGRAKSYTKAELDALPLMDYDSAWKYRDSLLEASAKSGGGPGKLLAAAGNNTGSGKSAFGPNSLGAAETGGTPTTEWLLKQYGAIKPGESPKRPFVEVPQETREGKTQRFARTAAEANSISDEASDTILDAVRTGDFAYIPVSNQRTYNKAVELLSATGEESALKDFSNKVMSDRRITKDDIAMGEILLSKASQRGDMEAVRAISSDLAQVLTEAGQTVQSTRILKRLTPEGMAVYVQRTVDRVNRSLSKKGQPLVKLSDETLKLITTSDGEEALTQAAEIAMGEVGAQIKSSWQDKVNAWRYLAMLGNPRTHIKNILGNALFSPVRMVKNAVGAGAETLTNDTRKAFGLDPIERSKAILNPLSGSDKALKKYALESFSQNKKALQSGGKYSIENVIQENQKIFDTKLLEKLRTVNMGALEAEDVWALKGAYTDSFAQYMKANRYTPEFMAGSSKEAIRATAKAQDYAAKEAWKATFRDANEIAEILSSTKRNLKNSDSALARGAGILMEGMVPFTKTPANIISRGVEYSPIQLIKSLTADLYDLKVGKKTATEFIDGLATGLTGTGLFALGAWLAKSGILNGKERGSKKEIYYNRTTGSQEYSINLPDGGTYTIDWLSPTIMPIMAGVEYYNQAEESGEQNIFGRLGTGLQSIADPVFNMSMLQGIMNTTATFKDDPAAAAGDVLGNMATSYAGQFTPTLFGQITRTMDPIRKSTFSSKDSVLTHGGEVALRKQAAKLPGISGLLEPSIDQWGRMQKTADGNTAVRAFMNMVSPGYYKADSATPLDKEIQRLSKALGTTDAVPSFAARYITNSGKKVNLTPKQYTTYSTQKGQTSQALAEYISGTKYYKGLSDEEKSKAISDAFELSNTLAKSKTLEDYTLPNDWTGKSVALMNSGVSKEQLLDFRLRADADGNHHLSGAEVKEYLDQARLDLQIKRLMYSTFANTKVNPYR